MRNPSQPVTHPSACSGHHSAASSDPGCQNRSRIFVLHEVSFDSSHKSRIIRPKIVRTEPLNRALFLCACFPSAPARKRLGEILSSITTERKEKNLPDAGKDLLSCMLNSKNESGESTLRQDQIADNIIGVLFSAHDTTTSSLTWVIKYLHDNPKILEAVKAEQREIYMSNGCGTRHLTWNQTRTMPVTYKVILESLRMASIISFAFRDAVTDVEYKGT